MKVRSALVLIAFGLVAPAWAQQPPQQVSAGDAAAYVLNEIARVSSLGTQALGACQQGGAALKAENDKLKAEIAKLKDATKPSTESGQK